MHKWGLMLSANCRFRAEEQMANHSILASCLLYHLPNGALGLAALDDGKGIGRKISREGPTEKN